ncbi:hypothetical protein EVAR_81518_1 [Eumeta japonica]|uniref:Uncharacterized protein n=1 Tax=Eumeta variegata TaxID=151549 RepID=A0A4C1W1P5_EUMVA|nr:hypothetical protein EVAR_81518_1 [Eumeta japonica]
MDRQALHIYGIALEANTAKWYPIAACQFQICAVYIRYTEMMTWSIVLEATLKKIVIEPSGHIRYASEKLNRLHSTADCVEPSLATLGMPVELPKQNCIHTADCD